MMMASGKRMVVALAAALLLTLSAGICQEKLFVAQDQPTTVTSEQSLLASSSQLLLEMIAIKIEIKKEFVFGLPWEKTRLEEALGKPLRGRFQRSTRGGDLLDVETLVIEDPAKIMNYLSRFGEATLLYMQTWSQNMGEQVSRDYQTVIPYVTRFNTPQDDPTPAAFTQSSVKVGMTSLVTVSGMQLSSDEPSCDVVMEITMKDAYKTPDNLYAVNTIVSADATTIPLSHTLIQSNLFIQGNIRNQYLFLLTPRKMR